MCSQSRFGTTSLVFSVDDHVHWKGNIVEPVWPLIEYYGFSRRRQGAQPINRVKENAYWLGQISENSGRPRKLWKAFPSIMGLDRVTSTPIGCPSSQDLLEYFVPKIETIRKATGGLPATIKLSLSVNIFSNFEIFSTEDVRKLIMSTKSKSCSLDTIPTNSQGTASRQTVTFYNSYVQKVNAGGMPTSLSEACHQITKSSRRID